MKRKILLPTLSLFAICLVAAVLLALTNRATADKIEEMNASAAKESQAKVLDMAASFEEQQIDMDGVALTYQIGKDTDNTVVGYVFTTTANGYGGQVKIMTGVLPDGAVHKIEILDVSSETPGLGQNAQNESFYTQFSGKKAGVEIVKNDPQDQQVKAITGATITSRAVTKAVNEALNLFQQVAMEGGVQ